MKRIIKYNYINDNISFINKLLSELDTAKTKLTKNVNLIENDYQGEDGKRIMNKYLNKIILIDEYINNVNKYLNYFKWLVGEYEHSQRTANNKMLTDFKIDIENITEFGE